jgi:hypothetical protein
MRISNQQDDPGFAAWLALVEDGRNMGLTVSLDGVELSHCLTADTDAGYVLRHRLHDDGRVVVDNGVICTEELRGTVVVFVPDKAEGPKITVNGELPAGATVEVSSKC